jgi:hypothetical protein
MAFENIFTHGNLVDVTVGIWTAERKLQPEDLGLKGVSEAFSLGHKALVPTGVIKRFKHLDNVARTLLIKYSFAFEFGSARFVPKKRFVEFAAEMDKTITEFNREADDFAANYDRYRLQMRQPFVKAAHEAYDRLKLLKGFTKDENSFVNEYLASLEKLYPKVSEIRNKYHMEYTVFQAALPDLSQASYADIAEEGEKIKMMQEAYRKSLSRKVESFVERITKEQREKAQVVLNRFSDNIRQGKKVYASSMSSLNSMIENYEKMDIIGDTVFLTVLKNFKDRLLNNYTAEQLRSDESLCKMILDEISVMISTASDQAVIAELANQYRQKINL